MFIKAENGTIINTEWVDYFYICEENGEFAVKASMAAQSVFPKTLAKYNTQKKAWVSLNNFYNVIGYQVPTYSFEKGDIKEELV